MGNINLRERNIKFQYWKKVLLFSDVCLKENVGIADSLYNLRLIRSFCDRHLVLKCFHFTYEDLLYAKALLYENVLVFVAELFFLLDEMRLGEAQEKETVAQQDGRFQEIDDF